GLSRSSSTTRSAWHQRLLAPLSSSNASVLVGKRWVKDGSKTNVKSRFVAAPHGVRVWSAVSRTSARSASLLRGDGNTWAVKERLVAVAQGESTPWPLKRAWASNVFQFCASPENTTRKSGCPSNWIFSTATRRRLQGLWPGARG